MDLSLGHDLRRMIVGWRSSIMLFTIELRTVARSPLTSLNKEPNGEMLQQNPHLIENKMLNNDNKPIAECYKEVAYANWFIFVFLSKSLDFLLCRIVWSQLNK